MGFNNWSRDFKRPKSLRWAEGETITLMIDSDHEPERRETEFRGRPRLQWILPVASVTRSGQGERIDKRTWYMGYQTADALNDAIRQSGAFDLPSWIARVDVTREGSGMDDTRYLVSVVSMIGRGDGAEGAKAQPDHGTFHEPGDDDGNDPF